MSFNDFLKAFSITDEDRKNLSKEEIALLEDMFQRYLKNPPPGVTVNDAEKFSFTGMQPVGEGPMNWKRKPTT